MGGRFTLTTLIYYLADIVVYVLPLATGICLIVFLWSGFNLVRHSEAPDKRKEAIQGMIWSGIGFFVVVSLSGIIAVLRQTLQLN